jgi:hypothetical protein
LFSISSRIFSVSFSISSLADEIDLFSVFVLSHKALTGTGKHSRVVATKLSSFNTPKPISTPEPTMTSRRRSNGGQDQMWVSLGPDMVDRDRQCCPALVNGMMLLSCGAPLMLAGGSCCSRFKFRMSRSASLAPALHVPSLQRCRHD